MTETVTAVVVTYNRKQLLGECIDALLQQTRVPDRILIIDNASTDGTQEMFADRADRAATPCEYVRLAKNVGGAGGFHEGMRLAQSAGADWLWLMDDDGWPAPDCLATLLSCRNELRYLAPIVCDASNKEQLAFNYSFGRFSLNSVEDINSLLVDRVPVVRPFNGVLVHRELIDRIGLPMEEMFIWGDEAEYMFRARHAGFGVASICAARFFHPPNRMVTREVLGGILGQTFEAPLWRKYCFYRNQFVIRRKYRGLSPTFAWLLYSLAMRAAVGEFSTLPMMIRAFGDAMCGRWGREQELMKLDA
jgi:rhamnopyranosyl-N-acetylglucosaminyl-diphospho-decaprenol beta-1,3/1,4-galactofuranosyltransferase